MEDLLELFPGVARTEFGIHDPTSHLLAYGESSAGCYWSHLIDHLEIF
jgi:hypothetical protein